MRTVMLGSIALALCTGCESKCGNAKCGVADTTAKMEGFQKSMCDCSDRACTEKVDEDFAKWQAEWAQQPVDPHPDPELVRKQGEIMGRYRACMAAQRAKPGSGR